MIKQARPLLEIRQLRSKIVAAFSFYRTTFILLKLKTNYLCSLQRTDDIQILPETESHYNIHPPFAVDDKYFMVCSLTDKESLIPKGVVRYSGAFGL